VRTASRIAVAQWTPAPGAPNVASSFFGRADDIDEQDRGERLFELGVTTGSSAPARNISSQRFIAMAAPPRDRGFRVVLGALRRTAANCFVPRWKRPVNLPPVSGAKNLHGAPFQENRRADASNAPCL
jgi:hypothetical protein